ncbi:hypothetical protein A1Q2_05398 [Trichosporon asahii var. asahii CBS 8904]|uniref:Uncharacterized protein n=1 Tax=Trichosporon asahii var. asahii (strain CBS 8904) TaxID=1220162 RepID=K1VHB5_TRIAC|nr:hypothetical protein A1Q2_05398 [Trichosporon asahii var. asahii CBS 8904]
MARYRPPPPPPNPLRLGGVLTYSVRIDGHLGTAMLEWWEALIVGIVVLPITALFWYSCFKYFPSQFHYMSRRFAYYVFGDENVDMIAAVRGYIAELLNLLWFYIRGAPAKAAVGHEL